MRCFAGLHPFVLWPRECMRLSATPRNLEGTPPCVQALRSSQSILLYAKEVYRRRSATLRQVAHTKCALYGSLREPLFRRTLSLQIVPPPHNDRIAALESYCRLSTMDILRR